MLLTEVTWEKAIEARSLSSLDEIMPIVTDIVTDVRTYGDRALLDYAKRFGDLTGDEGYIIHKNELLEAATTLDAFERKVLERTRDRIYRFAEAQRRSLNDLTLPIEGGFAGHTIVPLRSAACYAPGGLYPLPSSVLMTTVTARAAGVETVWVLSPRPTIQTLAAAAIGGADALLAIGGAQAIAAAAFGTESIPKYDIIVGPGNRWVTAAKKIVSGEVKIDMLAGPSELVIVADETSDPATIAADLLAQAEHDPDARVGLIVLDRLLIPAVNHELAIQLRSLPSRAIAEAALANGFCVVAKNEEMAATMCNALAPEHLSIQIENISGIRPLLKNYGGLFLGPISAEAFGDYGIGPNHVLPTQASATLRGGLSVFDFLRVCTWMELSSVEPQAANDMIALARMEGLEAHARSVERRTTVQVPV